MKKLFVVAVFCFILLASFFTVFLLGSTSEPLDVFVGIDVAYDDVDEIKALVDETCSYVNTFVVGSTGITYNVTKLNAVCEYIYDKGMNFMIYMHPNADGFEAQRQWVETAEFRWGQSFLGLYAYDEPGGRQLDNADYMVLYEKPDNYTDAAEKYAFELEDLLAWVREDPIYAGNMSLFISDYALYWFDARASMKQ